MPRRIAYVKDATAGGSTFDSGSFGTTPMPAAVRTIPTTEFEVSIGNDPLTPARLMTGTRADSGDVAWKYTPTVTAQGRAFTPVLKDLFAQALPTVATTGAAGTGYVHTFTPALDTATYLPAVHIIAETDADEAGAAVRRGVAGCQLNQLGISATLDQEARFTASWRGNYYTDNLAGRVAPPALPAVDLDYIDLDWQLTLRDCKILENGSSTGSAGVTEFSIQIGDQLGDVRFDAGLNRQDLAISSVTSRLWWPNRSRLAAVRPISGTLNFRDQNLLREARASVARGGQLVAEFTAGPLTGTTPAAVETVRINLTRAVLGGEGPGSLNATDDVDTQWSWKATGDSTGQDISVEIVDLTAGPVALPTA